MSLTQKDITKIKALFDDQLKKFDIRLNSQSNSIQSLRREIRASENRLRKEMKALQFEVRQDINSIKIYLDTNLRRIDHNLENHENRIVLLEQTAS